MKPFNWLQLQAEGLSHDAIAQRLEVTPKTIYHWRNNPQWDRLLKEHKRSWVEEYETAFTRLMPTAALPSRIWRLARRIQLKLLQACSPY